MRQDWDNKYDREQVWDRALDFETLTNNAGKNHHNYFVGRPIGGIMLLWQHWINRGGPQTEEEKEEKAQKGGAFPVWCPCCDPETRRSWKTREMADSVAMLLRRHKIRVSEEIVNQAKIVLTTKAKKGEQVAGMKEVQEIILTNNSNPKARLNPYMISYDYPTKGKGISIVIGGCLGHELGEDDRYQFLSFYIDRDKQENNNPKFISKFLLPANSILKKMSPIQASLGGFPLSHPTKGVDIQLGFDKSQKGSDMYSVARMDRTKLKKSERKKAFGRFRVSFPLKKLKDTGLSKQELGELGFKKSKSGKALFAIVGLDEIWNFARFDILWSDEDGVLASKYARFLGDVELKIQEKEEPLVEDVEMLYKPHSPDDVYEAYKRCGYLDEEEEEEDDSIDYDDDDESLDEDDEDIDDDDEYGDDDDDDESLDDDDDDDYKPKKKKKKKKGPPKSKKKAPPKKKEKSKKAPPKSLGKKKKKKSKKAPPKSKSKKSKKKCVNPGSSFGNFLGDRTCLGCSSKVACAEISDD